MRDIQKVGMLKGPFMSCPLLDNGLNRWSAVWKKTLVILLKIISNCKIKRFQWQKKPSQFLSQILRRATSSVRWEKFNCKNKMSTSQLNSMLGHIWVFFLQIFWSLLKRIIFEMRTCCCGYGGRRSTDVAPVGMEGFGGWRLGVGWGVEEITSMPERFNCCSPFSWYCGRGGGLTMLPK